VFAPGLDKSLQDEGGGPEVRGIDPGSGTGFLVLEMSARRRNLDLVDELLIERILDRGRAPSVIEGFEEERLSEQRQ
jgi:hypothetical protein